MNATITSPEGTAIWPALTTPTNFKGEGPLSYECKLKLDHRAEGVEGFIGSLEEAVDEGMEQLNEQRVRFGEKPLTATQFKKRAPLPFQDELDDEGNETGFIIVKAKLKAERKIKGEMVAQRPALFDASGFPFNPDTPVWSGSTVKLAVQPAPYFVPALGYGVTLRLKAAQILRVVNATNDNLDAGDFGFDQSADEAPEKPLDIKDIAKEGEAARARGKRFESDAF